MNIKREESLVGVVDDVVFELFELNDTLRVDIEALKDGRYELPLARDL